jgi:hypothetical protein
MQCHIQTVMITRIPVEWDVPTSVNKIFPLDLKMLFYITNCHVSHAPVLHIANSDKGQNWN